jgi:hypothetical protein
MRCSTVSEPASNSELSSNLDDLIQRHPIISLVMNGVAIEVGKDGLGNPIAKGQDEPKTADGEHAVEFWDENLPFRAIGVCLMSTRGRYPSNRAWRVSQKAPKMRACEAIAVPALDASA